MAPRKDFELRRGGAVISFAAAVARGDVVVVPHVETAIEHRGEGNADRLMAGLLDLAIHWLSPGRIGATLD